MNKVSVQHIRAIVGTQFDQSDYVTQSAISEELVNLSREHKTELRCVLDGVEVVVRYQPHAIIGSYLLAKTEGKERAYA